METDRIVKLLDRVGWPTVKEDGRDYTLGHNGSTWCLWFSLDYAGETTIEHVFVPSDFALAIIEKWLAKKIYAQIHVDDVEIYGNLETCVFYFSGHNDNFANYPSILDAAEAELKENQP